MTGRTACETAISRRNPPRSSARRRVVRSARKPGRLTGLGMRGATAAETMERRTLEAGRKAGGTARADGLEAAPRTA
jgi:hypothetical protein